MFNLQGFQAFFASATIVMLSGAVAADDVLISDSDFNNGDWNATELIDQTPSDTFVFSATQQPTGGNPADGPYRDVVHNSDSPVGTTVQLFAGHLYLPGSFDPGEDGTIASICFELDGRSDNSTAGAVGYGLYIVQDGMSYIAGAGQVLNGVGWQNLSRDELGSANFNKIVDDMIDNTQHPDFSDSGSTIQFGYYTGNGTFGDSNNFGGVDNWLVTIKLVDAPDPPSGEIPEPSTAIALVGMLGLAAARRRRNA